MPSNLSFLYLGLRRTPDYQQDAESAPSEKSAFSLTNARCCKRLKAPTRLCGCRCRNASGMRARLVTSSYLAGCWFSAKPGSEMECPSLAVYLCLLSRHPPGSGEPASGLLQRRTVGHRRKWFMSLAFGQVRVAPTRPNTVVLKRTNTRGAAWTKVAAAQ